MLFSGAKEVLTGVARALGRPSIPSRAEMTGLVVTAVSLAVLLPVMGMMGAAVASLLSYGVTFLVVTVGLVRSENLRLRCLFPLFVR
jgi:Na+-driven multidrug efflux pump